MKTEQLGMKVLRAIILQYFCGLWQQVDKVILQIYDSVSAKCG
jgi:hypothetical protein